MSEADRKAFLDEWAETIGPVPFAHCELCHKDVDEMSFDASVERQEYQFIAKCHGDTQVYHIDFRYASAIAERMKQARATALGDPNNLRWNLLPAFHGSEDRVDGRLHYDYIQNLFQRVDRVHEPAPQEDAGKLEFDEMFKKAEEKGDVIKVDTKGNRL